MMLCGPQKTRSVVYLSEPLLLSRMKLLIVPSPQGPIMNVLWRLIKVGAIRLAMSHSITLETNIIRVVSVLSRLTSWLSPVRVWVGLWTCHRKGFSLS